MEMKEQFDQALQWADAGEFGRAVEQIQRLRSKSDHPHDQATLLLYEAQFSKHLSSFVKARELLHQALQLVPNDNYIRVSAFLELARIDRAEQQPRNAVNRIEMIEQEFGEFVRSTDAEGNLQNILKTERGLALAELGRFDEALPLLLAVEDRGYAELELLFQLGRCLQAHSRFEDSIKYYQTVINMGLADQFTSVAHFESAYALNKLGRNNEAIEHLQQCEARLPSPTVLPSSQIYELMSKSLKAVGRDAEADKYLKLVGAVTHPKI